MIYPDFLKKGDTIYVTAPSDGNSESIDYIRLTGQRQPFQIVVIM